MSSDVEEIVSNGGGYVEEEDLKPSVHVFKVDYFMFSFADGQLSNYVHIIWVFTCFHVVSCFQ